MEGRYLLPCSCGQEIPVEPRQAGQEIRCDCGASLEVPTMLGMAALEKAPSEPSHTPPSAPWGTRQGIILLGTVIVLLALGMVIPLHLTRPALPTAEMIRRRTQTLSPFQSWRHWHVLRARGPDPWTRADDQAFTDAVLRHRLRMGVVLAIAAGGVAMIAVPLLRGRRVGRYPRST